MERTEHEITMGLDKWKERQGEKLRGRCFIGTVTATSNRRTNRKRGKETEETAASDTNSKVLLKCSRISRKITNVI
jgi:hypothetical protein